MPDIFQQLHDALSAGETATVLRLAREIDKLHSHYRVLELPCRVGTIVFTIYGFYCPLCKKNHERIEQRPFELSMLDDFGKTVFLTQEEAEEALKERKKNV